MSPEVEAFRKRVIDALGRMAEVEERLCADAERGGDETMSLVREHGAMCLREAQSAIEAMPHE